MASQCPYCSHSFNTHSSIEDPKIRPHDGDASICWGCKKISIFNEDGSVRRATLEEEQEISNDKTIKNALKVMKKSSGPLKAAELLQYNHQTQPPK